MRLYDSVRLLTAVRGLPIGARGTIVESFNDGKAFMVEFFDDSGSTIAVEPIKCEDLRRADK